MKTDIVVENNYSNFEIDLNYWENVSGELFSSVFSLVNKSSQLLEYSDCDFSFDILFVNDDEIKEINRDYRKKDRATDVITFALFFDSDEKFVQDNNIELGEILISLDTAKRQAEEAGIELDKEIKTLVTHGILHLLGFDHLTQEDYNFVVDVQNKVVS